MEKRNFYGYFSGFVSSVTLQPLENIKMVMLVPPSDLKLTSNFLSNVSASTRYLYNDGWQAFYRGLIPNVLRSSMSSGVFFTSLRFCEKFTKEMENYRLASFMCSLVARVTSCGVTNPLSIIETRY